MYRILVGTGLAVALTATGCSGSGSPGQAAGTPSAHSSSPSAAVYHQAAQCLRTHGAPGFPDPTQDPQTGKWELPSGTRKPPESVMNACRSILSQIPEANEDNGGRPPTAAEMAKAKQWAQCMRRHGLPHWPDPDADGTFQLPQSYAQLGKRGLRTQLTACQKYGFGGLRMSARRNG